MGLIKLGSKLGSISAKHASGTFSIAEDLKQQMRVTDGAEKGPKLQKQESASDKFYRKFASETSSEQADEEKSYFVKQKSRGSGVLTNWGFSTQLHRAAEAPHTRELSRLLLEGAPVDGEDEEGCTALHCAAAAGRGPAVELLLDHGAAVDARSMDESTPLHKCAAWQASPAVVELLAARGADVNARTDAGWTPLHEAAVNGRSETLTKLLDLGAKLQATTTDGDTALHKAARWGHAAAVQLLLRRGADVHARDKLGRRPIDRADTDEVINLLLHAQASRPAPASESQPASAASVDPQVQAECEAADLKESYDVRWVTFAAQSSPASLGDVPFPVHQDDSHLLLDVLLWGAQGLEAQKKRLRAEQLRWHPDKFSAKFGGRLQEANKEAIMQRVSELSARLVDAIRQLH